MVFYSHCLRLPLLAPKPWKVIIGASVGTIAFQFFKANTVDAETHGKITKRKSFIFTLFLFSSFLVNILFSVFWFFFSSPSLSYFSYIFFSEFFFSKSFFLQSDQQSTLTCNERRFKWTKRPGDKNMWSWCKQNQVIFFFFFSFVLLDSLFPFPQFSCRFLLLCSFHHFCWFFSFNQFSPPFSFLFFPFKK